MNTVNPMTASAVAQAAGEADAQPSNDGVFAAVLAERTETPEAAARHDNSAPEANLLSQDKAGTPEPVTTPNEKTSELVDVSGAPLVTPQDMESMLASTTQSIALLSPDGAEPETDLKVSENPAGDDDEEKGEDQREKLAAAFAVQPQPIPPQLMLNTLSTHWNASDDEASAATAPAAGAVNFIEPAFAAAHPEIQTAGSERNGKFALNAAGSNGGDPAALEKMLESLQPVAASEADPAVVERFVVQPSFDAVDQRPAAPAAELTAAPQPLRTPAPTPTVSETETSDNSAQPIARKISSPFAMNAYGRPLTRSSRAAGTSASALPAVAAAKIPVDTGVAPAVQAPEQPTPTEVAGAELRSAARTLLQPLDNATAPAAISGEPQPVENVEIASILQAYSADEVSGDALNSRPLQREDSKTGEAFQDVAEINSGSAARILPSDTTAISGKEPMASAEKSDGVREVSRAILDAIPKPMQAAEIDIRPPGFGNIHIRIAPTNTGSDASWHVTIRTSDPAAHALLSNNLTELRQHLKAELVVVSANFQRGEPGTVETNPRDASDPDRRSRQEYYERNQNPNRGRKALFELLEEEL